MPTKVSNGVNGTNGSDKAQEAQEPPRPSSPSELEKWRQKLRSQFKNATNILKAIREPLPNGTDGGRPLDPQEEAHWVKKLESDLGDLGHLGITDVKTLIEMSVKWKDSLRSSSSISLTHPHLGQAGMPYARTVKPQTVQPAVLPEPGQIFDSIFARKDENREPHPNRISSVLFYLGSLIIHDVFRTDHDDYQISQTSSYLDLSPLYGANAAEQKTMRTFEDGKIYPDCFADKRVLGFPPGVSVLLIMFNRFHNDVVQNLAEINEAGRFTPPIKGDPRYARYEDAKYQLPENKHKIRTYELDLQKRDEDLFQTARLVTCGLYVNCILLDYVRTILNLNRTDSKWQLNPRMEIKGLPLATGNQVSAEFNLVYRWHAAISAKDEEWTNEMMRKLFPDCKDFSSITGLQMVRRLEQWGAALSPDPMKWPIADGLSREQDSNKFSDDDLVKIMTDSIDDPANSFGANRVPVAMKAIEILGIKQARAWNLGTLNEFRKYFQLEPHREFTDINPDPEVADQLRHLYGHPDLVEMYPGLMAEDAKVPKLPGSGLCPSYTVSRAVLSDAVALVRGDRFYTVDYHPKKLTNWGYQAASSDLDIDNGCVFYKLFTRAFPNHFKADSVYAHFPLTVPKYMKIALQDLGKEASYSYDKPQYMEPAKTTFSYAAAETILKDDNADFKLTLDNQEQSPARKPEIPTNEKSIVDWEAEVARFYEKATTDLLKQKSYKLAGKNQVDIIHDVCNLVHVRFCAELFTMPLKGKDIPGIFDDYQLYMVLTSFYASNFMDLDPQASFALRQKSHQATQLLGQLLGARVTEAKLGGYLTSLTQLIWPKDTTLQKYGNVMIQQLLADKDMTIHSLVWDHIMVATSTVVSSQAHVFAEMLDFFLAGDGNKHLPELRRLSKSDAPEDFDTLMHYMLEGSRLRGEPEASRYAARNVTITDGDQSLSLRAGDRVFVNLRAAAHDPAQFLNPEELDLNRPVEAYDYLGWETDRCLFGLPMMRASLTAMLKAICRLEGVEALRGAQGQLQKRVRPFSTSATPPGEDGAWKDEDIHYHRYLSEMLDSYLPFPVSLKITWDSPKTAGLDAAESNGNGHRGNGFTK
ncbi:hypothetical protein KJ359_010122 [Pestalotiopsis sp. 9143b]|nr:hypothetical protein KJ359_010122 [Pestalotiopsis sp. 9143b]